MLGDVENPSVGDFYSSGHTKQVLIGHIDAILDSSFDGIWICDSKGRVIRLNKAAEEINSVKSKDVVNRKVEDLVKEGLVDRAVVPEVLKKRSTVSIIQRLKNGKQVLLTGNPIFDRNGDFILVLVNERDITALNDLQTKLQESIRISRAYLREIHQLQCSKRLLSHVVIRCNSMQRIFDKALRAAQFDSTVLIEGETGVGKSLLARLIHESSSRKEGPFIRVDCSAIPEALIESELFGYKAGAFTGASQKGKPGHFELATGGTLLLDEIGEIPLKTQVKLLRFLEENVVVRIGGTEPRKVNARIIAASNRDLGLMVYKDQFRRDLFFRLNVIPIRIPPLRERTEEIPYLLHFFLEKFNRRFKTKRCMLRQTIDCIRNYSFPGNIRELANLVEQLVVLAPNDHIAFQDLPNYLRTEAMHERPNPGQDEWDLRKAIDRLEKRRITEALESFGTQRKAAGPLGINQSTLARKIRKHGITQTAPMHHSDA